MSLGRGMPMDPNRKFPKEFRGSFRAPPVGMSSKTGSVFATAELRCLLLRVLLGAVVALGSDLEDKLEMEVSACAQVCLLCVFSIAWCHSPTASRALRGEMGAGNEATWC